MEKINNNPEKNNQAASQDEVFTGIAVHVTKLEINQKQLFAGNAESLVPGYSGHINIFGRKLHEVTRMCDSFYS